MRGWQKTSFRVMNFPALHTKEKPPAIDLGACVCRVRSATHLGRASRELQSGNAYVTRGSRGLCQIAMCNLSTLAVWFCARTSPEKRNRRLGKPPKAAIW
jgi:hypothetical protein